MLQMKVQITVMKFVNKHDMNCIDFLWFIVLEFERYQKNMNAEMKDVSLNMSYFDQLMIICGRNFKILSLEIGLE